MRVPMGAGNSVPWDPMVALYIIEPMNCLASREYDAVIFVGPVRTGKTIGLIDGWVVYNVVCDPSDMLDLICFDSYGAAALNQSVAAVLEANRGLADYGSRFPAGVSITLPDWVSCARRQSAASKRRALVSVRTSPGRQSPSSSLWRKGDSRSISA